MQTCVLHASQAAAGGLTDLQAEPIPKKAKKAPAKASTAKGGKSKARGQQTAQTAQTDALRCVPFSLVADHFTSYPPRCGQSK